MKRKVTVTRKKPDAWVAITFYDPENTKNFCVHARVKGDDLDELLRVIETAEKIDASVEEDPA